MLHNSINQRFFMNLLATDLTNQYLLERMSTTTESI